MVFIINMTFLKNGGDLFQLPKGIRVFCRTLKAVNEIEKLKAYEHYEFRWAYEYGVSMSILFIAMGFSVAYPNILPVASLFFFTRVRYR